MPTDTIYGLVGLALNKGAVEKIYELRQRNKDKPCIILISSIDDLKIFGINLTSELRVRLEKLWPGKVSIIMPQTVDKERPEQGKIVAVGPGKFDEDGEKRIPLSVKKGDLVLFTKYGPSEIKIDGKEYLIAKEEDILAILE